jgi:hypothetical protein
MSWSGGLAEWQEGETVYLSVAFTYKLDEAFKRAQFAKAQGLRVVVGGPALFLVRKQKMQHVLTLVAEVQEHFHDAVTRHNPEATFASRGCPVGCTFCIVPQMEGSKFTLIPDFPVRPILCDNNLSALPAEFQDHIISRYIKECVPLRDANSGFEPRTFTEEVYRRWKPLVNAGGGPWRFAYDDMKESAEVRAVMQMLKGEPANRKRVYVLIGNEPFDLCMERIYEVIAAKCEPHVQPYLDLNTMTREPRARFDWTTQRLKDVARWANGFLWRKYKFSEYDRTARKQKVKETYDEQQGLFV